MPLPAASRVSYPICGDVLTRELPNSTACYDCYRAALYGLTKAQVQAADARCLAETQAEVERLKGRPA